MHNCHTIQQSGRECLFDMAFWSELLKDTASESAQSKTLRVLVHATPPGDVMQTKVLSTIGAAALALSLSATVSHAGYMQPGETMGLSLISPLPEGVFAADLESYGRSKPAGSPTNVDIGVNIPVLIWSTPITFYNTRLEILAGIPFAHVDGSGLGPIRSRRRSAHRPLRVAHALSAAA